MTPKRLRQKLEKHMSSATGIPLNRNVASVCGEMSVAGGCTEFKDAVATQAVGEEQPFGQVTEFLAAEVNLMTIREPDPDQDQFLDIVELAANCYLWALLGRLVCSPRAGALRLCGTYRTLRRLSSAVELYRSVYDAAQSAGKVLEDEPKVGHPFTKMLQAARIVQSD